MDVVSLSASLLKAKNYTDEKIATVAKGMDYKGSVATVSDLPTAGSSNKGWLYTVTANGHEYVSDGTQWVDLSSDLVNKEDTANKVTSISSSSTDTQYPSAKAVYDAKSLFFCTYGTTTYQEILTAISNNKLPVVMYNNKRYVYSTKSDGDNSYVFSTSTGNVVFVAFVSTSDVWSNTFYQLQQNNLVTSISSSSTDTQYPSAKAVYDNLSEMGTEFTEALETKLDTSKTTTDVTTTVAFSDEEMEIENAFIARSISSDGAEGDFVIDPNAAMIMNQNDNGSVCLQTSLTGDIPAIGLVATNADHTANGQVTVAAGEIYINGTVSGSNNLELTDNKVTSISSSSTDAQYPSAKCVYDAIQGGGGSSLFAITASSVTQTTFLVDKSQTEVASALSSGKQIILNITTLDSNVYKIAMTNYKADCSALNFETTISGDNIVFQLSVQTGTTTYDGYIVDKVLNSVSVSNTGTATDEIGYITIDGVEKKIAGGTDEALTYAKAQGGIGWKTGSDATVTWDGDTTGKTSIDLGGITAYKISTLTPSATGMLNGEVTLYDSSTSETATYTITSGEINTEMLEYNIYTVYDFYVIVALQDNITIGSITITEKGIYLTKIGTTYVSNLEFFNGEKHLINNEFLSIDRDEILSSAIDVKGIAYREDNDSEQTSITWDGDTTGKTQVGDYYLISSPNIKADNLYYGYAWVGNTGIRIEPNDAPGTSDITTFDTNGNIYSARFVFASYNNATIEGLTFPTKGIYFHSSTVEGTTTYTNKVTYFNTAVTKINPSAVLPCGSYGEYLIADGHGGAKWSTASEKLDTTNSVTVSGTTYSSHIYHSEQTTSGVVTGSNLVLSSNKYVSASDQEASVINIKKDSLSLSSEYVSLYSWEDDNGSQVIVTPSQIWLKGDNSSTGITIDGTVSGTNNLLTTSSIASASTLGGIKVGTGLSIDANGVLSVSYSATENAQGGLTVTIA